MPERAEIEAVARVRAALSLIAGRAKHLREPAWDSTYCAVVADEIYHVASDAIEALDRVRDARDDNNGRCRTCGEWVGPDGCERCARSPQGEDHESHLGSALAGTWPVPRPYTVDGIPQGEDHEAGIEAYRESLASGHSEEHAVIAAIRTASPSPSRDGTVAVEDVVKAARAFVESWWEFDSLPPQGHYNAVAERVQVLNDALAEFPVASNTAKEGTE